MKTIIFTIICIIALLWVGDFTITFKPFSISLPGWYKPVGIILFVLTLENTLKGISMVSMMG